MFSLLSRSRPVTATINGRSIKVLPKETILTAALRNGVAFPYSCKVGGCATCKCKLLNGKVKELTNASYILSEEDLRSGYILACQSVPRSDVLIEVDETATSAARRTGAKVLACDRLTHDILRLRVQLDEALPYQAGQFATLEFDGLPGVARSYSFASPPSPAAQTNFYVRKVPGGAFSTFVHETALVGQRLRVEGPQGEFWLRDGQDPLLMVAGGSGLAPILAMLEHAKEGGHASRPVHLLFGARTSDDLYELENIRALQAQWKAPLTFSPILSAEPIGSEWKGERGLVADFIPPQAATNSDAYLCGPPPMVDAVLQKLLSSGGRRERIHADRFITQKDLHSPQSSQP